MKIENLEEFPNEICRERLFYDYVRKAEEMDPLRAIKLLTKEFDVIHIDPDDEEQLLSEMMNELDEETVSALCRGYWLGNL